MIVKLQILIEQNKSATVVSKSELTHEYRDNLVDQSRIGYDILFVYKSESMCDPTKLDGEYRVNFGDGDFVLADCKGVVEHLYTKDGTYTAKYIKDGKTIATTEVIIKERNGSESPKASIDLYEAPAVAATLSVANLGDRTIKVIGTITPPTNCVGTEKMEAEIYFSYDSIIKYSLADCKPIKINMTHKYNNSSSAFFPEIRIRWVNATRNSWTYNQLVRYIVDYQYSDDSPLIRELVGGSKG